MAPPYITQDELDRHATRESLWVVADEEVVIDVTLFINDHPGGVDNILKTLQQRQRFSFTTHFAHTHKEFLSVVRSYLSGDEDEVPWTWSRSRSNGGLDKSGIPTPADSLLSIGTIKLVGVFQRF